MSVCPNCGIKLRLIDWKPECPACGVNLNYYNANERLLLDSEKAEIEHAHFQPKVDRAKAAYAGSIFAVLRIVFTLLPVGALFLPLAVFKGENTKKIDVIALYNYISKADIGKVFSSGMFGVAIAALLVSAVFILVCEISNIASLGKHGKGRTAALYGIMAAASVTALISFLFFTRGGNTLFPEYSVVSVGLGGWLYTVLQLFSFCWNLFLLQRGIPVKYTPCIIGGLPAEEYFSYVESGYAVGDIRRKMLIKLTELQLEAAKTEQGSEKEARA